MSDIVRKNLGSVTAYKYAVSKGYTGTEEEFAELMASYATVAEEAEESANTAAEQALKSEGNAVGKQNGTDVPSGSPYYHNNAKWYAQQAAGSASSASSSASAASSSAASASGSASTASAKASNAGASATMASNKAAEASSSATSAAASATAAAQSATAASGSASAASTSESNAASSATAAQTAQTAAETAQTAAEAVLESIPEDYSELSDDVTAIKDVLCTDVPLLTISNNVVNVIVTTSDKWSASDSRYKSYMIPVYPNARSITVTAKSDIGAAFSLLKSREYTARANVDYAGETGRNPVPMGTSLTLPIPDDCKYVNVLYMADGNDYTPLSAYFSVLIDDNPVINKKVDYWMNKKYVYASITTSTHAQGEIVSTGATLSASDYIAIPKGQMLTLPLPWTVDTTYGNFGVCLYDKDGNAIEGRCVTSMPKRQSDDDERRQVWIQMYIPDNAKYFRTTYWSESTREELPVIPEFTYSLTDIPNEYKPVTHELPVDTYMQNAIRRARQLTDVKWTPRVNIPRYSRVNSGAVPFLDWFYADHEYIGIPYSGAGDDETHWSTIKDWGYTHNWVGQHIPIESFVTAARYPNSIMGEKAGQSAASYDSSPFGDVCTALVNYAVDGPTPLRGITNFFNTSDNAFKTNNELISDMDMNDISIGDFLYTQAHVVIITDLLRDLSGNVTHIEIAEETTVGNGNNSILGSKFGGVARRKMHEVNAFKSKWGGYTLYRRATFYGISYTPSNYVDTGNEGDRELVVDYPCIPYLGNGAIYKVGYIHNSKICIGATGFTSLVVTKDGEAFGTFDVTGLTEVSVGFSDIGNYEAYLTDGTTTTMSCNWSVVA